MSANWTNGAPTSSSNVCITVGWGYTVTVRGSTNAARGLTLDALAALAVSGSPAAGDAKLTLLSQGTASGGIRSGGTLVLTTTDANAAATVDIAGGTLFNGGDILVDPGAGNTGGRLWHGALGGGAVDIKENLTVLNAEPWHLITPTYLKVAAGKKLRVDSGLWLTGATLWGEGTVQGDTTIDDGFLEPGSDPGSGHIGTFSISGNYTHGGPNKGQKGSPTSTELMIDIGGPNAGQFDVLQVTGAVTIRGLLYLRSSFNAMPGQTFPILTAASRSGTFRKVGGAVIDNPSALYYAPTYPPNGVTLEVRRATTSVAPSEGPPGTSVALTGSSWTAGDSVKFKLVDSKHQKFKNLGRATVDASGNFSGMITIPSGAATGAATLWTESSIVSGRAGPLNVKKTFVVTSS